MKLLLLTLLFGASSEAVHECIHDSHIVPELMKHPQFPLDVPQGDVEEDMPDHQTGPFRRLVSDEDLVEKRANSTKRRLSAGGTFFRIHVDYSYLDADKYHCLPGMSSVPNVDTNKGPQRCGPEHIVSREMKDIIKRGTTEAINIIQKTLRVLHPSQGALKLKKYCYQFVPLPAGNGNAQRDSSCYQSSSQCTFEQQGTDYVMMVTANPTSGSTLAWALACQNDKSTGRPIAGMVNYGPNGMKDSRTGKFERFDKLVMTAVHEISHALGFSSSSFDKYIDEWGRTRGKSNVVRQFDSPQIGHPVTRIITPKVKQYVKTQFDCHDWPDAGGELEDYGGSGTAGSHWEKRVYRNEFMTGTVSNRMPISAISLALFEDMGWYKADFGTADHLEWGYREGCNFAAHKCSTWDDRFFCRQGGETGCTHTRKAKGYCNAATYGQHLPVQHQYFRDPKSGGQDAHADYCPFFAGYSNALCFVEEHGEGKQLDIRGEKYGENSLCFDSNIISERYVHRTAKQQNCFEHECSQDGLLTIIVAGNKVRCPAGGGKMAAPRGFQGHVWCPPAREICLGRSQDDGIRARVAGEGASPKVDEAVEPPPPQKVVDECAGAEELEQALSAKLSKGDVKCIWIDLQKRVAGRLGLTAMEVKGDASVYMRADSVSKPTETYTSNDGEETVVKAGKPNWPTAEVNDYSSSLNAGQSSMVLPKSLLETAQKLLIRIKASNDFEGQITLTPLCANACQNGGKCDEGVCKCTGSWTGERCTDRVCPGTGDCSGKGDCDVKTGRCVCGVGWTGDSCSAEDQKDVGDANSGTVPVGAWTYFKVHCPDSTNAGKAAKLTYRMLKNGSPRSDPFLFGQVGNGRPSETAFVTRDLKDWRSNSNEHVVEMDVRTGLEGGATIGIHNREAYGKEALSYTGSVTCELKGSEEKACPSDEKGVCGGHGTCVASTGVCNCDEHWNGAKCSALVFNADASQMGSPQLIRELKMKNHDFLYFQLVVPEESFKKKMRLQIQGLDTWMGISVNAGSTMPKWFSPRTCDRNNYARKWLFEMRDIKTSFVDIPWVNNGRYTVMLFNNGGEVAFNLEVILDAGSSGTGGGSGLNFMVEPKSIRSDTSFDDQDPFVPLEVVGEDGRLPSPVLSMSSHSSVTGMAHSSEMQLVKIEEFCSQSRSGLYNKCSNLDGTVTLCSDKPAMVYHGTTASLEGMQPKDASDFSKREVTQPGAPKKRWAHLSSWVDNCKNHVHIEVGKDNQYLGIASAEKGEYVTFTSSFSASAANPFLSDAGGLRSGVKMTIAAAVSSLLTAAVCMTCGFGYWYRGKKANDNAQRFTNVLRSAVTARKDEDARHVELTSASSEGPA